MTVTCTAWVTFPGRQQLPDAATSSAVCFPAMHTFWQPAFIMLHELVINGLTDTHPVGALPLLGVNQHLRKLVIPRLVAAHSKAAQVAAREKRQLVPFTGDGEFVSVDRVDGRSCRVAYRELPVSADVHFQILNRCGSAVSIRRKAPV